MRTYLIAAIAGVSVLLGVTGCEQGLEITSLRPSMAASTVGGSGAAEPPPGTRVKRALVDVDQQKLRHVIKPGETLEWKGVRGTSNFVVHFAPGKSPCAGNDYPGSATAPASCVVSANVQADTEFPYELRKNAGGLHPAAYYFQVKSCSGCFYSTEP